MQSRAHDAYDDAHVLAQIFTHSSRLARSLDLPLPVVTCSDRLTLYPDSIPRTQCAWENPGRLDVAHGLVQGMRVVISGDTRIPRLRLAEQLTEAGLDVMNSVSRYTSVVVCTDPASESVKVTRARSQGIPVITEHVLHDLVRVVRPGTRKGPRKPVVATMPLPAPSAAPWVTRRVLVMGGSHAESVLMRSRLIQLGATPAVNLSAGVTDVLLLSHGDGDPRMPRVRERQLTTLSSIDVDRALNLDEVTPRAEVITRPSMAPLVPRGGVVDLPENTTVVTVDASWRAADTDPIAVDVVAFLTTADEVVSSDEDFVFYNAPSTSDGAVVLSLDGDSEQGVRIDLSVVPDDIERIVIAAAIENEHTFGDVGAVSISLSTPESRVATAVLDAATTERSLILTEIYRRGTAWRCRAVGQGYDDGLADLATRYGVVVDD